jgi:cytochrome c-type biogenesis protein CcmH
MTALFIAIAALLTLLVVAWVVRPLLRPAPQAGVSSQRLNAAIYRDQLETLERDLARGAISPADYEATRDELQLRLLDDTEEPATAPQTSASFWTARRTAAVVALVLPLGGAGLYWWLGTPQAIDPARAAQAEVDKVMQMVDGLAARLKANPDNPKGWVMLARSYKVMGRLPEAEQAFAKVGPLLDTDPDLLADYADLLAARSGTLDGQPMVLVNKALALNPVHPMALMLAGTAAYRQGKFADAARHWEKMLAVLPPGSPDIEELQSYIADARAKAGLKPATAAAPQAAQTKPEPARPADASASVSGVVDLDAALKARAAPDDVLMVIARVPGTRMPVAVLRTRAADLPLKFTLDDSLSMSPQARLSMATEVDVEARISKSGMAQPEPGDLISAVQTVKVGTRGLKIHVAKVRP